MREKVHLLICMLAGLTVASCAPIPEENVEDRLAELILNYESNELEVTFEDARNIGNGTRTDIGFAHDLVSLHDTMKLDQDRIDQQMVDQIFGRNGLLSDEKRDEFLARRRACVNQGKAENARIERTEASKIVCDFVLNRLWDETDKLQARIDQKFGAGYSQDRIRKNARAKDLELQAYENSSSDIPPQSVDREVKDCVDAALQGDSSVGGVSKSEIELACRLMLQ